VVIHHLVCRGTVDEKVMDALHSKGEVQQALLDALKGYLTKEETI
jgi:SNF2 family DNA or RNA helicase